MSDRLPDHSVDPVDVVMVPVGLDVTGVRAERDSLGSIDVPADRYWGAQTQRCLEHFAIGGEPDRMPVQLCHALATVKQAAARVNVDHGGLAAWMGLLIERVAAEVAQGALDDHFPLQLWQSGSGTQTNMNVNEVISNRCIQLVGGALGSKSPVHPNDHVNMSQSSNDVVPTAMHIAAVQALHDRVLPELDALADSLEANANRWGDVVKIGRTHLQDAVPITVGQEWSGYVAMVCDARDALAGSSSSLLRLAVGGTAVGTGLNAPEGFDVDMAAVLSELTGRPFVPAPNKFAALGTLDAMVRCSAGLRNVAVSLFKIANDLRWLASGPRAGLAELRLPANEPGSSIMPGKVNPSQAEAMQMVAVQVMANDAAVAMAGKEGNLELNTFRPVVISNVLRSMRLLADASSHFRRFLVDGVEVDRARVASYVERSAMLVTALSPEIGYDRAAAIAHDAVQRDVTLRDAALAAGVDAELFDRLVVPIRLTGTGSAAT